MKKYKNNEIKSIATELVNEILSVHNRFYKAGYSTESKPKNNNISLENNLIE